MIVIKNKIHLQKYLQNRRKEGNSIGFAPTMGALHEGHLSLIDQANTSCDISVCSIFVNPTQFNNKKDLEKYPRTESEDLQLLHKAECDLVFLPDVDTIYPPGETAETEFDFGHLDKVMEGAFRPGHFAGVANVVKRLLDIVMPDSLFMGQKDFQQFTIIASMLDLLKSKIDLILCPTVRSETGLALSSRNRRLSATGLETASIIFQTLEYTRMNIKNTEIEKLKDEALKTLKQAGFTPEYFEIVDGFDLMPVTNYKNSGYIVACTASWLEDIRLIDNMILKQARKT